MGWKLENMWRAENTFAEFLIDHVGDCKDFDSDHTNDAVDKEWSHKKCKQLDIVKDSLLRSSFFYFLLRRRLAGIITCLTIFLFI